MKKMSKLLLVSVVASSVLFQGCTDEEMALGTGVVVGGVIGAAIGSSSNNKHDDHRYDHRNDHGRGDYGHGRGGYGEGRGNFRPGGPRDGGFRRNYQPLMMKAKALELVTDSNESLDVVSAVASRYDISEASASKIVFAIEKAEAKDFSGVEDLGLSKNELIALYNDSKFSNEAINKLGSSLNIDEEKTLVLVDQMREDVRQEKARLDAAGSGGFNDRN